MSDEVDIGHGMLFKRESSAGSGTYVTIPGMITPAIPNLSRDSIDATDTESPDRYREFFPGMRDAGELQIEFNERLGNAEQAKLYDDFHDDDLHSYRIVCNDADSTTWTFDGFITGIEGTTPLAEKKTLSATFKISGKPVLT